MNERLSFTTTATRRHPKHLLAISLARTNTTSFDGFRRRHSNDGGQVASTGPFFAEKTCTPNNRTNSGHPTNQPECSQTMRPKWPSFGRIPLRTRKFFPGRTPGRCEQRWRAFLVFYFALKAARASSEAMAAFTTTRRTPADCNT